MKKLITASATLPGWLAAALFFGCAGTDVDADSNAELDGEPSLGTAEMALLPRDSQQPWEVRLECRVSCLEECSSLGARTDPAVRACASSCARECRLASPAYACIQQEPAPFSDAWLGNVYGEIGITAWGAACNAECSLLASASPFLVPFCQAGCDYVVDQTRATGHSLVSICH